MQVQSLAGEWRFRQLPDGEWLPAIVPGSNYADLLRLGLIPDPFFSDHEKDVQWVGEADWEYQLDFEVPSEMMREDRLDLVCTGLDTLAEVSLNGSPLGCTDNMFRLYRWDIRTAIVDGSNHLSIVFRSPVRYISNKLEESYLICGMQSIEGSTYLRKAASQFGWDWGPQLATSGVWRDIHLEGRSYGRIENLHLRQEHLPSGEVRVHVNLDAESWGNAPLAAKLVLIHPDGTVQTQVTALANCQAAMAIAVEKPQLWWPNGYGKQPIYQVTVLLLHGDKVIDERKMSIGLRTLALRQEPDEWGRSFTFVINGVPIFAKGTNWIPADSLPSRATIKQVDKLLSSAAQANHNMIRVWGGGYYEDEAFYDLCDRLGILVWQDFMFACGIYPLNNADLLATLRQEVLEQVRRLRHHACLALWCGNNEMEQGWVEWGWGFGFSEQQAAYDRFFHQELPALIECEDPDHAFWPSSPSSNTCFENPNGQYQGDSHYWEVWHGRKPFSEYKDQYPRFMSEFGFQSLPTLDTARSFLVPAEENMCSYSMERHQKSPVGNELILTQMAAHYRMPSDFESTVYLSMVLQAEGIRTGVEHWRRNKHRTSGTLYWQLNDCWPAVSWSSLDYAGRWKALHYASRRFYAPVLLSIDLNEETAKIHVTSDQLEPIRGELIWSLQNLAGKKIAQGNEDIHLKPQESKEVCRIHIHKVLHSQDLRKTILVCHLVQEGKVMSTCVATFVPDKHIPLEHPCISLQLELHENGFVMDLCSDTLARHVELSLPGYDVVFSDNYFDLLAGFPHRVTAPLPQNWTLQDVQSRLIIRSLRDSYA